MSLTEGEKAEDLPGEAWRSESESERVYSQDCSFENSTYHVGDFVYVEPSEPNLKPHIVCIERLWEDEAGNISFFGKFISIQMVQKSYCHEPHTYLFMTHSNKINRQNYYKNLKLPLDACYFTL